MADITATARASSQDVSGCGATIKKVGGGNAPYFTEKLVVEVDCRSPEATVIITSYFPACAFGGNVMGKADDPSAACFSPHL
jgi:hypothetical protein